MSKYDCEKTRDFIHEWKRYSLSRDGRKDVQENTPVNTWDDNAIERIQKWSDEHPEAPKLTKREHEFLATFLISIDKAVVRGKLMQDLYIHDTRYDAHYAIDPTMFSFIQEEERMTFDELLQLEVEE